MRFARFRFSTPPKEPFEKLKYSLVESFPRNQSRMETRHQVYRRTPPVIVVRLMRFRAARDDFRGHRLAKT